MIDDQRPPGADQTRRSACYGDRRFTSTDASDIAEAEAICRTCDFRACVPVLRELMASTTDQRHVDGVWNGDYYSNGRKATPVTAIQCGTEEGYHRHRRLGTTDPSEWPLPKDDPCGCREAHRAFNAEREQARKGVAA